MTSISAPLWNHLPILRPVQFPWRLGVVHSLCVSLVLPLAFAAGVKCNTGSRVAGGLAWSAVAACFAIAWALPVTKQGVWQVRGHLNALAERIHQKRFAGTVVLAVSPPHLHSRGVPDGSYDEQRLRELSATFGRVQPAEPHARMRTDVLDWRPRRIRFEVISPEWARVVVGQFYFDGWRARLVTEGTELPVQARTIDLGHILPQHNDAEVTPWFASNSIFPNDRDPRHQGPVARGLLQVYTEVTA
jgi:hypothetical protein